MEGEVNPCNFLPPYLSSYVYFVKEQSYSIMVGHDSSFLIWSVITGPGILMHSSENNYNLNFPLTAWGLLSHIPKKSEKNKK